MRSVFTAFVLALLALVNVACDGMGSVTFVNETEERLQVYVQSDVQAALLGSGRVEAGTSEEESIAWADYSTVRVAATREDGEWVFDRRFTRDELKKQKERVVVSSLEPVPPPSDIGVAPPLQTTPPAAPAVTFVNATTENPNP